MVLLIYVQAFKDGCKPNYIELFYSCEHFIDHPIGLKQKPTKNFDRPCSLIIPFCKTADPLLIKVLNN